METNLHVRKKEVCVCGGGWGGGCRSLLAPWPLPVCEARLDDIMTGHVLGSRGFFPSNLFRHACGLSQEHLSLFFSHLLSPPHPLSSSLSDRAGRLHYPPVRSMLAMTGSSTGHPTIDTADSAVCVYVCVMINVACGSHDVDEQVMSWSVKSPQSCTINVAPTPCYFPFLLPPQTHTSFCIIIFTIWHGLPLLFFLMAERANLRPAEQTHGNTVMFLSSLPSWKIL